MKPTYIVLMSLCLLCLCCLRENGHRLMKTPTMISLQLSWLLIYVHVESDELQWLTYRSSILLRQMTVTLVQLCLKIHTHVDLEHWSHQEGQKPQLMVHHPELIALYQRAYPWFPLHMLVHSSISITCNRSCFKAKLILLQNSKLSTDVHQ